MSHRLAYVEDEPLIRDNYSQVLMGGGYTVDAYATPAAALAGITANPPALAILDIELNGVRKAGYLLCRQLLDAIPGLPIIFLTQHEGDDNEIHGLQIGAHDYITKNSSERRVLARIEALLGRSAGAIAEQFPGHTPPEGIAVHENQLAIYWNGVDMGFSVTRYLIVRSLYVNSPLVRSHHDLMCAADMGIVEDNTIATHLVHIRRAFAKVCPDFDAIKSEYGRGYRWLKK
jgi:two-component system OmpR family response regulator